MRDTGSPGRFGNARDKVGHARRRLSGRGGFGAMSVGSYVPGLTRTCFEKFGFSIASLITDWTDVVGQQMASASVPERLSWSGRRGTGAKPVAADGEEEATTATLVLRVDPSRALEFEYGAAQVIERVNTYLGFRAVTKVKVVQGKVITEHAAARSEPPTARPNAGTIAVDLGVIVDGGLRDALASLSANVLGSAR